MDAFGFLADCLALGVEEACDRPHRGGFERMRSRGQSEPIRFEIYYRQSRDSRPISYTLAIDVDAGGRPFISFERLRQGRQRVGQPDTFLQLEHGRGMAWAGESTADQEGTERVAVNLENQQILGITTLGNLAEHTRIVAFRQFLEGWYLSYFMPDAARQLPTAGAQKHLDRTGYNLANYVQFLERQHAERFKRVLERVARKIPGVERITHTRSPDGRLLLAFNDRGYADPFYAQDMSDGTLKFFAYMMLLEDPEPAPLIGIEEPENGLHHQLLGPLAREMMQATRQSKSSQIIVTTHSPHFVDELRPEEVWILRKNERGETQILRAADVPGIKELYAEGLPLGTLWYSNHFGQGNP
jgi:predicted ATPase